MPFLKSKNRTFLKLNKQEPLPAPSENEEPTYDVKSEKHTTVKVKDLNNLSDKEAKAEIRRRVDKVRQLYFDKYGKEFPESVDSMVNETWAHKKAYDWHLFRTHTDICDMGLDDFENRVKMFDFPSEKKSIQGMKPNELYNEHH